MMGAEEKLSRNVQRWIYEQGWQSLREIQAEAIEPIYSGKTDVLISAATAGGKTEAFFLPACSVIEKQKEGIGILYISPLKALINDQYRRLESLAELLDMSVTAWHGDSSQSKKAQLKKNPSGILLITPESLESLFINASPWVLDAFQHLKYIVIDEFHAFLGAERGYHLLSLLNRLEHMLKREKEPIPRIALSATLGELETVPNFLRPNASLPCVTIRDTGTKNSLLLHLKAFVDKKPKNADDGEASIEEQICRDIFKNCRGGSHLVFANSRREVENISARLLDQCEKQFVPNEFFPHHGSLSKELRADLESRLQEDSLPTTAICTMTLELGIDIGKVNSVTQINAPYSVSSLRQRQGRSGRRNSPSKLRLFVVEDELNERSDISDFLRLELMQSIAMAHLLVESKWFEPVEKKLFHFSTLLHQILAMIAQWGSIRAEQLFDLLCKTGPFQNVTVEDFKSLLQYMGQKELITQLGNGALALALGGERLTSHYSFYASFQTPEEYRLIHGVKTLGTLPIDQPLKEGQPIIFAGRKWAIISIDTEKKTIHLKPAKGGKAPNFLGLLGNVHDMIRQKMFSLYCTGEHQITQNGQKKSFIDPEAQELFKGAVQFFHKAELKDKFIFTLGGDVCIAPWLGDKSLNTIIGLLHQKNIKASNFNGVIKIENAKLEDIQSELKKIITQPLPTEEELAGSFPALQIEKFDQYLPENLLNKANGSRFYDIQKASLCLSQKI